MHYETIEEAKIKWYKRSERINWDAIYIKFDASKDLAKLEDIEIIDNLTFKYKIIIGKDAPRSYSPNYIKVNSWELNGAKMFEKSIKQFDLYRFIHGRGLRMTLKSKLISWLID